MARRTNVPQWLEKYNRWQIKVRKDGIRKTFTSPTPGRKGQRECQAKADAWLDDGIESTNVTVAKLYKEYLDELKLLTSVSHWQPIESRYNTWIAPAIGTKKISVINNQHIQDIINSAHRKGRAEKTIKNIVRDLTAFFKYARKRKVTTHIVEDIKIPRSAPKPEKHILDHNDMKTLFSSTETTFRGNVVEDLFAHAYRYCVATGLRPGELRALKHSDIRGNIVSVHRSINVYEETTGGKNKNARRSFAQTQVSAAILADQAAMLKQLGIISQYVFPDRNGLPPTYETLRNHWERYKAHNGISDVSLYEMRHTFVSINKTMPEGLLKSVVGHSQDMDTFGVYGHTVEGDSEAAAALIDANIKRVIGDDSHSQKGLKKGLNPYGRIEKSP